MWGPPHPFAYAIPCPEANNLRNCKVYMRGMPAWARRWLKEIGNFLNKDTTSTTPIEIWASTVQVQEAWERQKELHKWSFNQQLTSVMNEKKLEVANGLFKNRWAKYQHLEVCTTFFRLANEIIIEALSIISRACQLTMRTIHAYRLYCNTRAFVMSCQSSLSIRLSWIASDRSSRRSWPRTG